ncbi:MAG: FAD-binding oxidoreductase [Myxococcales bacterium]|nr:MAG: FAD-binding oxidoreductase [Myxococcales bacterium]
MKILPNDDQKQMLTAIGRVLSRHAGRWNAERSGNVLADLQSATSALAAMVGRSAQRPADGADKVRKFWGWGYEGEGPDPMMVEVFLEFLKARFGLDDYSDTPAPNIENIELRAPRFALPEELAAFCTDARLDRAAHSYGKAFRDIVRALHGEYDNPTDYVAYPETEEQILALIRFCEAEGVSLTPYGGGSSVVGGVEPTRSERYRGTISLDMRNFDRVLEVDEASRAARVQAGIYGPALEAALKPYGLSPRFYPQSFEFSTLGGWIATRAGGHYCTLYTHIEDIVESVRVVTPQGIHESRRLPASGAGPSQERLWCGSEGTLGVITEAWIRLHGRPRYRSSATVKFDDFVTGARAVRELSQGKLYPVNCRLVSRMEAVSMGLGDGRHAMLLLGFESEHYPQKDAMDKALKVCREHGGRYNRRKVTHTESRVRSGAAGSWRNNFIKAPYIRDIMAAKGMVTETVETAITWDRFEFFHQQVNDAAQRAFDEHCRGRGIITCRFTHIYPDGPAPYYTIVAWSEPGRQLETWDAIKASVSDAIIDNGGTITHHHAVGRDHRPWYERERGDLFTTTLTGLKSTLDPEWVLNPGVLLEER